MDSHVRVLVTGGAGYIGSAIVDRLVSAGHEVVVLDNLSAGQREKVSSEATLVEVDVLNQTALDEVFRAHTFDLVIHCAAKKVITDGEADPATYYRNNVVGTLNVLSAMERFAVPKIIFSSTAAVYEPHSNGDPVDETMSTKAVNVYGQSKLMSETLVKEFHRLGKISSYIIFRFFTTAGDVGLKFQESDEWQGIFNRLAKAVLAGEPFVIKGTDYETRDGTGVRDYIHVADLVEAHMQALSVSGAHLLNLGTSNGYSVREIITTFEAAVGQTIPVVDGERRPGDVPVMLADARLAHEVLGWRAEKTIDDIVASFIDAYGIDISQT